MRRRSAWTRDLSSVPRSSRKLSPSALPIKRSATRCWVGRSGPCSIGATLRPGLPVFPMLAKPTKKITEVLERLSGQAFTAELKYDGERAQIHLMDNGQVMVFSRSSENTTEKYPELRSAIRAAIDAVPQGIEAAARSFVIDSELVLSTRKKKGSTEEEVKVQVIIQAFDILYLNGESLLHHSLRERREILRKCVGEVPGRFDFANGRDYQENGDSSGLETFLDEAVAAKTEGLMVKRLDGEDSAYTPSKRTFTWLKLKRDYLDGSGVADSLDLVCIGGFYGKGKRTGFYGAYLLACYDVESEKFQSVCKLGTGFSDADLDTLQKAAKEHETDRQPPNVMAGDSVRPDVWFRPEMVWEIRAADLSLSSVHKGALNRVARGRGIGLRFPRYLRQRQDKRAEDATTSSQVLEFYQSQDTVK
eukprot:scaffold272_cov137-Pinguiococcus_pyrenoidosus.AAC.1